MKNQKGMSLVELLAAISILFVVSAIIYGIFFGFSNNYEQISKKNNMNQAANIVITTIKQHHQQHDQYQVSYDQPNKAAYIGVSDANNPLGDSSLEMEIRIGFPEAQAFSGIKIIDSHEPLTVHLKLKNDAGQSYEVETIIKRY